MELEKKINEIIHNYNLGNFLKAESLAKSLLTKNGKDYQLCNINGLILLKLNKTEGAIRYFQKSIHTKADFFDAHFNLLQLFYDLKKYDKAILQSKECLKINSGSVDTLILLGNIYSKLNQEKESEKYFRKILKINSENSDTAVFISVCFKTPCSDSNNRLSTTINVN